MLKDTSDEFYGARLVADARLHLGSIVNGQYSEAFFVTMCKIMSNKIYLGYKTFGNKDIKMSGIKDFFFNCSYGLGLKRPNFNDFLANCTKAALNDKTQSQYAFRFIKWLKDEDPAFDFPQEYFEYKRIKLAITTAIRNNKHERWRQYYLAEQLYANHPHLLCQIGPGRKYKNIVECCDKEDIKESAKTIRFELYSNPTIKQVEKIAEKLHERLDCYHRKVLIAKLLQLYKESRGNQNENTSN